MMNKRDFFKSLMGGTAVAGLPAVKSVETLSIRPLDVLVIKIGAKLSHAHYEQIRAAINKELPGQKVLIISGSDIVELQVLRKE